MARIVHLCPRYAPARGGVESFFCRLSDAFARHGHDVSVWTTDAMFVSAFQAPAGTPLPAGPETIGSVTVRRFPVRYVPFQKWTRTAAHLLPFGEAWKCNTLRWTPWVPSLTAAAWSDTERVDLVHVAGLPYSSLIHAGVRLAERTGARLVITPFTHVPAPGRAGQAMRHAYLSPLNIRLLRRADVVLVQTVLERRLLAESGIPDARLALIGVGISPTEIDGGRRAHARRAWAIDEGTVVVGHLGNKSWDKGTFDLMVACDRLTKVGLNFRLVLAGLAMPGFKRRLSLMLGRDRVIDLPQLSEEARRDFFAAIDIFALPSYVESFGLSALEAAWCGAAVIAYDHGGPGEILCDGASARLVAAADIEGLARGLTGLIEDAGLRRRLAEGGRQTAMRHTWPGVIDRAMDVYTRLLSAEMSGSDADAPRSERAGA